MFYHLDRRFDEMSLLKPTVILISEFNEVQTLKSYRHYARANFEQTTNHSNLWKFLVELNTQYELVNLNELIDDFICLEDKYFLLKNDIDVMPMYQSLRNQLEHLKQQQQQQQQEDYDGLQNIFHAALIGKYLFVRFVSDDDHRGPYSKSSAFLVKKKLISD